MALTLEQYATYLDNASCRGRPRPGRAAQGQAASRALPKVRAVLWNVYGTLLAITGGELLVRASAAVRHERGPGQDDPGIQDVGVDVAQARPAGRLPEAAVHAGADRTIARFPAAARNHPESAPIASGKPSSRSCSQKDYKFDAGFFGSLNEFSRKVAYFFHASLQGTAAYDGAADALRHVAG